MPRKEDEPIEEWSPNQAATLNRKYARKRTHQTQVIQTKISQETSPVRKKIKNKENTSHPPPGFENSEEMEQDDPIKTAINEFVNNLNINDVWKQLIMKIVVPF